MPNDPSFSPRQTVDYSNQPIEPSTIDESGAHAPVAPTASAARPAIPGDWPVIAGYEITGEIGKGGMGRVFAGKDLTLNREVAIKTLLPGGDADRFVTESKITARLPHPGIPPVHALGNLADGSHYLIMKLIRGRTLADLLNQRKSPSDDLSRWVQVFEQIALAVGFAHSQGIIHRDLKPLNVMVGAFGEVQVMDWGLAKDIKIQERDASAKDVRGDSTGPGATETGAVLGTPGYLAPEQARGKTADARADVFALGAILCVILTGKPPITGKTRRELIDNAAAGNLAKAFSRLDACGADAELVTLAQRCLAVKTSHRPGDARVVAEQVAAYRASVEARLRQAETESAEALVRETESRKRRRQFVSAAAIVAAVLLVGIFGTSYGMWWASTEAYDKGQALIRESDALKKEKERADSEAKAVIAEKRANEKEREATAIAVKRLTQNEKLNGVIRSIFSDINPRRAKRGGPLLIEALTKRLSDVADEIEPEAIGEPWTITRMQVFLGSTLLNLGDAPSSIKVLGKAWKTAEFRLGPDHPETLATMSSLALAYMADGKFDAGIPLLETTLAKRKANFGDDHEETHRSMNNLGVAYQEAGELAKALLVFEEVLAKRKAMLGSDHPATLATMSNLGEAYREDRQTNKALSFLEETLERSEARLGRDHPDTLIIMNNLAEAYHDAGNYGKASKLLEETLAKRIAILGGNHPATLVSMNNLALLYQSMGLHAKAISLLEETLAKTENKLGRNHFDTFTSMANLGDAYLQNGQLANALPLLIEAHSKLHTILGPDHPSTVVVMAQLASARQKNGQFADALSLHQKVLSIHKAKHGQDHTSTLVAMAKLAQSYEKAGELSVAVSPFEATLPRLKAKLGLDDPTTIECMNNMSVAYLRNGQNLRALGLLEETLIKVNAKYGSDHNNTLTTKHNLAAAYKAAGMTIKADALAKELDAARERHAKVLDTIHDASKDLKLIGMLGNGTRSLTYQVRLKAGIAYAIDMVSPNQEGIDPYICLFDEQGKMLAEDDDSGGGLNARIVFRAPREGVFKIQAAAFNNGSGPFTLTVRVTENALKKPVDNNADSLAIQGFLLFRKEEFGAAEKLLRQSLSLRQTQEPEAWTTFHMQSLVGASLLGQKKHEDAEPLLLAGLAGMAKRADTIDPRRRDLVLQHGMGALSELFDSTREKQDTKLQGKVTDDKKQVVHEFKFTAGKAIVVLMNSNEFDTLLQIQNPMGKLIVENDDIELAAKKTNSRIWFMPPADGVYRIVATSYQNQGRGDYEIIVRQYGEKNADEKGKK